MAYPAALEMAMVRWHSVAVREINQKRSIMIMRQSASIHVCALRHVPEMVKHTGARHLISAINAYFLPDTPTAISDGRHLKLDMNDIVEAQPDLVLPKQAMSRSCLISCEAGTSKRRS
jgi:predicted protein tyrosine phosphatase